MWNRRLKTKLLLLLIFSSLTTQITELTTRLDTMETSIKKDIRNILEILQNPTSMSRGKSFELFDKTPGEQHSSSSQQHQQQQQSKDDHVQDKNLMAMQPSESEFSFELCMDPKRTPSQQQPQQSQQQPSSHSHRMPSQSGISQVHRSISQPECTNTSADKNLLRYAICVRVCVIVDGFFILHIYVVFSA